jgi:2-keto-3-deoxy-L-rhamnonate aldolase RhmA
MSVIEELKAAKRYAECDTALEIYELPIEDVLVLIEAVEALQNLKEAVEFTPLGVRGINAVEQANTVLEKLK